MSPARPGPAPFVGRVLAVVRAIPAGRVSTYGDVADLAGHPGAARAVGTIMARCRDHAVPCHRVVAAGGRLGGFGGHESLKRQLLVLEGCQVRARVILDFSERRWTGTPSARARRAGQTAGRQRTS